MKRNLIVLFALTILGAYSQINTPQYYDNTLSLIGQPMSVREYYYDRLAQIRAHYYIHSFTYNSAGKILLHTKNNIGLYDTIAPLFQNKVPAVGLSKYAFTYDSKNRLIQYTNLFKGIAGDSTRIDEEWTFDQHDMITKSYIWEWTPENGKTIKNPSYNREITRNTNNKVIKIEKNAFSFSTGGLVLSEITEYKYGTTNEIDTLVISARDDNGQMHFKEKWYDLSFIKYNALNTDSLLLASYKLKDATSSLFTVEQQYDSLSRQTFYHKKDINAATVLKKEWEYGDTSKTITIEYLDGSELIGYRYRSNFDQFGYLDFEETFTRDGEEWYPEGPPLEIIQRTYENGKIIKATTLLNDQDRNFYRLKADFEYEYNIVAQIDDQQDQRQFSVYPNPSQGLIYHSYDQNTTKLELIASDGSSKVLKAENPLQLVVPKGLYILLVKTQHQDWQKIKLIIE